MKRKHSKTTDAKIQDIANNLLKMFEAKEMPKAVSRSVLELKEGDYPSCRWSLGNQIIMLANGTTDARTFLQWKEVGRYPKKGSSAFYILAPNLRKIKDKRENEGKEDKYILVGFRYIPVFKYEDTEGQEIERPNYKPGTPPPLMEVAEKFGLDVKYGPCLSNYYGYYHGAKNKIMLCTHDLKTFFHELGHAADDRVKKAETGEGLKGGQISDQEITAEFISQILCQMYNIKGYEYHSYNYIKRYSSGDNKTVIKNIMGILADAEKAINLIIDNADMKPWEGVA